MHKRAVFSTPGLPYLLVLPQLAVTLVFFIWPAGQALYQSLLQEDAFGLTTRFVGLENFARLFADPSYIQAVERTFVFAGLTTVLSMSVALGLAATADRVIRGAMIYKTILIWPYAIAPAVAGVLWFFLFNPAIGPAALALKALGYDWNSTLNGRDAMIMVIIAAAWKQISYNFLFFLAGLQAIPTALIEAAAIDGAGPLKRFWSVVFPLLSPTTFYLLVINLVYAFFDTFAIIHATTSGGPANATEILVFKVYQDGFVGLDLGGSAAQSVVLMAIVIALTVVQFRFVERRVEY